MQQLLQKQLILLACWMNTTRAWYLRPALWLSIALIILLVAGFKYWQTKGGKCYAAAIQAQEVARGDLTLTRDGKMAQLSPRSINISELSGTVRKVNVDDK